MPEGQDPDDVLRAEGAGAVQARVDDALSLVRLLWQRETEGRRFDSPERKAALERVCREKTDLIRDPSLRGYYERELKDLRWQLFNPRRSSAAARTRGGTWPLPEPARASTKSSLLVAGGREAETHLREAVILATLVSCPEVVDRFDGQVDRLECRDPDHAVLRDLILRHAGEGAETLRARIEAELGGERLEKLMSLPHVTLAPPVRQPGDAELASLTLREELGKLLTQRGVQAEMVEATADMAGRADEAITWRLGQAAQARNNALRSYEDDDAEYELGENGAPVKRDEKEQFAALLSSINYSKPRR
jgi:DNA primase